MRKKSYSSAWRMKCGVKSKTFEKNEHEQGIRSVLTVDKKEIVCNFLDSSCRFYIYVRKKNLSLFIFQSISMIFEDLFRSF